MIVPYKVITIILAILWLIRDGLSLQPDTSDRVFSYSRKVLLSLWASLLCNIKLAAILLLELRPRKRGRRGGICSRIGKHPFNPPLPSIILSNVHSLQNKMNLLHASWKELSRTPVWSPCLRPDWMGWSPMPRSAWTASPSSGQIERDNRGRRGAVGSVSISIIGGVTTSRYTANFCINTTIPVKT